MWPTIAQFICLSVAVVLLTIAFDLDHETPWYIRGLVIVLCLTFFGVGLVSNALYEHAAGIAFAGLGVMIISIVLYLVLVRQIRANVMKVVGVGFGVCLMLWTVGSCSDTNRQKAQIELARTPTTLQK